MRKLFWTFEKRAPGWGHCVTFLGKSLNSDSASVARVYKWVLTNRMLGGGGGGRGNLAMDKHPIQGEQKYSKSLHAIETGISSGLMNHWARTQTSPLPSQRGMQAPRLLISPLETSYRSTDLHSLHAIPST